MTTEASRLTHELIWSKMQIPDLRAEVVARPRLLDQLVGVAKPLVLVHAPAGSGKSTLLGQWAAIDERRFAWISLDPSESDPVLFWRYVIGAVGAVEPELADHVLSQLSGPAPNLTGSVIPRLLNALTRVENPIVVVLDDYHRIQPAAVHESLSMFLRHLPRSITVALASRARPAISLTDMHARGLVLEIQEPDLRLTRDETVAAVANLYPEASADMVDQIYRSTEGWATGVYLASAARATEMITPRRVYQYVVAEMLDALDEDDRAFMQKTSILTELEPARCDHIVGGDTSATRIARLAASNLLMVRLDEHGTRFRYHHLLQDVLQIELAQTEAPEELRLLHHKAFEWHANAGDVSEAIHHAIQAGAIAQAVALVCRNWYEYTMRGHVTTAQRWVSWFAESELRAHPAILPTGANIHGFGGNIAEARRFVRLADAAEYEGDALDGSASYTSSVSVMHAALALDGPADALVHATRAAELEPPDSTWRPSIAAVLGAYRYMSGAKSGYYPLLIEGAQVASGLPEIAAYALGNLALIHAWRDEWEQASHYADEAVGQLEDGLAYSLPIYGLAYAVAAHAAVVGADTAQSEKLLTVAIRSEQQAPDSMPFDSAVLRTVIAEALVDMGRYREAGGFVHRALQNIASMGEGGYVERRLDRVVRHLSKAGAETGDRSGEAPPIGTPLSTRELQVLGLLATDLTLAEIGSQLYLSLNTVKTHTRRTYRKLDVHTRQQAVAAGRTLGYL